MEGQQDCNGLQIGEMEGDGAVTVDLQERRSSECKDGSYQEGGSESPGAGMAVLDFDVLCATVATQSQSLSFEIQSSAGWESGCGVQRMWEGGVADCCDDRGILLHTACCPCSTFGKNMQRAGFGTCFGQGIAHFLLGTCTLFTYVAFGVTKQYFFLYFAIAFTLSGAAYAGHFRSQIRKRFNIKVSDSPLDDCMHHLLCSCCTLCQEARTLQMNNVQDGIWHGRGDTILVGSSKESHKSASDLKQPAVLTTSPDACSMNKDDHAWSRFSDQSEPLVGLEQHSFS